MPVTPAVCGGLCVIAWESRQRASAHTDVWHVLTWAVAQHRTAVDTAPDLIDPAARHLLAMRPVDEHMADAQ